jgi:hypothetical protein
MRMKRIVFCLVIAATASGLLANDIAVSAPDGKSGWLLLENPPGATGAGMSEFAGDPGMPAPDAHRWPHALKSDGAPLTDGRFPETELWFYANGKYARATHFLGGEEKPPATHRRTLIAVVTIGGKPYVLHLDKFKTQLVRVDDTSAGAKGVVPAASIVLNTGEFIDAPTVSPDGKHIAFRAFAAARPTLRVYSTETWKLVAESETGTFARPVWIDNAALAVIVFEAATLPEAPQRDTSLKFSIRTLESHMPQPGKLMRADLAGDKLKLTELLAGKFPSDRYTRTVIADPKGLGLVIARSEADWIVAEQREPKANGGTRLIGRYEAWRGCSVADDAVRCAGVLAKSFVLTRMDRAEEISTQDTQLPYISPEGHGGMIDLGHGVFGMLEPVANPDFEPGVNETAQLLRHTLIVNGWSGCDTMRNPRVLQQLSKLVRRFFELGNVRSTLLVFDVEIAANEGRNKKSGRYVELYSAAGRKGNGAIRIEDNLSGQWLVQSIDGNGDRASDVYYSWSGVAPIAPPKMDNKPAANAGKAYDDLITQLEARKLLMLGGVENDWAGGGLTFLGRDSYRDPVSGTTWRTWVFEKYGRVLDDAKYKAAEKQLKELGEAGKDVREVLRELRNLRERIEIRFVANLPMDSAGDWKFPHAIAQVQMRFALSNQQKAAVTELTFEPAKWVALPNLVDLGGSTPDKRKPDLLLPKVFRIYGRNAAGKLIEELKATAVDKEFKHPNDLVNGEKLTPGYEVPKAALGNSQFVNLKR